VRAEIRRKRLSKAAATVPRAEARDATRDVLERERAARLRAAIAELSPKLREAFVLVYLEDVPGPEAAHVLGIREGALWKRLYEARVRLRSALQGVFP